MVLNGTEIYGVHEKKITEEIYSHLKRFKDKGREIKKCKLELEVD